MAQDEKTIVRSLLDPTINNKKIGNILNLGEYNDQDSEIF
jgi:hypothetical protein